MAQEYAFDRLARVLDNASANYLSEAQRRQRLAEQTLREDTLRQEGYDRADAVRNAGYAREDSVRDEQRKYLEAQKEREREQALIAAGFLTKKLGTNTPEEIDAAIAEQARRALMIRNDDDARRNFDATIRGNTLAELPAVTEAARAARAEAERKRKRTAFVEEFGDAKLTALEQEIASLQSMVIATPTEGELARARTLAGPPRNQSPEAVTEWENSVKTLADNMAQARVISAVPMLKDARLTYNELLKQGYVPRQQPTPAPAALTDPNAGDNPPPPSPQLAPTLDQRIAQQALGEKADKLWPRIASLYDEATLSDDAIRQRISAPVARRRAGATFSAPLVLGMASSAATQFPVDWENTAPTAKEQQQRLAAERAAQAKKQAEAAKLILQLTDYVPADPERRQKLAEMRARLNLQPTTAAAKQDNFAKVANTLAP